MPVHRIDLSAEIIEFAELFALALRNMAAPEEHAKMREFFSWRASMLARLDDPDANVVEVDAIVDAALELLDAKHADFAGPHVSTSSH